MSRNMKVKNKLGDRAINCMRLQKERKREIEKGRGLLGGASYAVIVNPVNHHMAAVGNGTCESSRNSLG